MLLRMKSYNSPNKLESSKAIDSGLGRMIHQGGRQGDTLFHYMGRNATHLVVDYSITMACAASVVCTTSMLRRWIFHEVYGECEE